MSEGAQVVDVHPLIFPQEGLAAFEIDEAGPQRVAILQLFLYLGVGLVKGILMVIDGAVLAAKVTPVRYENYAL